MAAQGYINAARAENREWSLGQVINARTLIFRNLVRLIKESAECQLIAPHPPTVSDERRGTLHFFIFTHPFLPPFPSPHTPAHLSSTDFTTCISHQMVPVSLRLSLLPLQASLLFLPSPTVYAPTLCPLRRGLKFLGLDRKSRCCRGAGGSFLALSLATGSCFVSGSGLQRTPHPRNSSAPLTHTVISWEG